MSDSNLIKDVCREFGFTYKDLSEKIGYSEGALKVAGSTGKISEPLKKAIELYLEKKKLEDELKVFYDFKTLLKSLVD